MRVLQQCLEFLMQLFCVQIPWLLGRKKGSDPVSSPLNPQAGTLSYTGYLGGVCRHLHWQRVVGSCSSQTGQTATCVTGVLEKQDASTISSAQCSATWQPFGIASCSPGFSCPFLGLLPSPSSCPVPVSPFQTSWFDSVALLVLLFGKFVILLTSLRNYFWCTADSSSLIFLLLQFSFVP